jgi:uncharacterized protein (TIGR03435 family)
MEQLMRKLCITLLVTIAISSNAAAQKPAFEVASIKPNTARPNGVSFDTDKGRFLATNASVRTLIRYAFESHLPEDGLRRGEVLFSSTLGIEVIGGPSWMNNDRFDVEAKPPANQTSSQSEMQLMVQSLLEDRFQLKAHREMREAPTFDLLVAKAGKLKLSEEGSPPPIQGLPPQPRGMLRTFTMTRPTSAAALVETMYGRAVSSSTLASQLSSWAGRPITDKTKVTGLFDVFLQFSPVASTAQPAPDSAIEPSGSSIFTALQQELGLKLEPSKGQREAIVIDHIEKPTEN